MFTALALIVPDDTPRTLRTVIATSNALAREVFGQDSLWPLRLPTACGGLIGFQGPEDFPTTDLRCPCRHPACYAVVWLSPRQVPPGFFHSFFLGDETDTDEPDWM